MLLAANMVNAERLVRLMGYDRLRPHDRARILFIGGRFLSLEWTGLNTMYRVIAIVGGGLALAACSSTPDWMSLDALKPAPAMDTVSFESVPPGAEAKTSNGQTCRTPCSLALPANAAMTVTFTLNGYQAATENIEPVSTGTELPTLRPNPVLVELTPAPPPPKPAKPVKPVKKPVAKKPAAKPEAKKPATTSSSEPPATMAAPPQQQAPWPQPTR